MIDRNKTNTNLEMERSKYVTIESEPINHEDHTAS